MLAVHGLVDVLFHLVPEDGVLLDDLIQLLLKQFELWLVHGPVLRVRDGLLDLEHGLSQIL